MYEPDEIERTLGELSERAAAIEVFGDAEVGDAIGKILRILAQLNDALRGAAPTCGHCGAQDTPILTGRA